MKAKHLLTDLKSDVGDLTTVVKNGFQVFTEEVGRLYGLATGMGAIMRHLGIEEAGESRL